MAEFVQSVFWPALWGLVVCSVLVFGLLLKITAPYGRHTRKGWGPTVPGFWGWMVMELPAVLTILGLYLASDRIHDRVAAIFLILWQIHYVYRTFLYPFTLRNKQRPMPILIVFFAMLFNVWNGFINGGYLFFVGPVHLASWTRSAPFVVGLVMFLSGMGINHHSDGVLRRLRKPGQTGYLIPTGGLYRFVSMPAYFGEILEWCGFAVLSWSPAGAVFALFTAANLVPRALSNHQWYQSRFPDYPKERRAVIPFVL